MNVREGLSTLAALSEMIEIFEWVQQFLFSKSDSKEEKGKECEKERHETWTSELASALLDDSKSKTEIPVLIQKFKKLDDGSGDHLTTETARTKLKPSKKSFDITASKNVRHPSPITEELLRTVKLSSVSNKTNSDNTTVVSDATGLKLTNQDNDVNKKKYLLHDTEEKEIYDIKKFTTSSWKLENVVESLYTLPKSPESSKRLPEEKIWERSAFVLSQGSFCNYPEGNYTVVFEEFLHIRKESEATDLLTMSLNYGEVTIRDERTLKLDNKLSRSLYFKCNTNTELQELKSQLETACLRHWESECINLVHYPRKCRQKVVIIDLGSCSTRAGILMDEPTLPFIFFPSICATHKITGKHVFGKEALQTEVRQNSNLTFPVRPSVKIIKHSIDVNLVGGLFKKVFRDLRVDPTEYTILVCLPRSLSISAQNEVIKVLLDDLKVKSVSLTYQAVLTLYAHNVSTGIVVDVGDRMDILPVVDGFIVESGVTRLPYGGQRLIHHMKHALAEKHISLSNDIDAFVVQYIADNLSYIAKDYKEEMELSKQCPNIIRKSIGLQTFAKDKNCVQYATLDEARFKIPEGLFKPELWGLDSPGIHQLVQKAIQATSLDLRKIIAQNIYVSGGVTLIPGFVERLNKEISSLNKLRLIPKVIASNHRYHSTYIGACRFARMEVFPKVCVNIEEYNKEKLSCLKKFVLCF